MKRALLATTILVWAGAAHAQSAPSSLSPGHGSVTDCHGHVWTINGDAAILEDSIPVQGGGDTEALLIQGCTVYGKDNGAYGGGWFTMNSTSPTSVDGWTKSAAPDGSTISTSQPATGVGPAAAAIRAPTSAPVVCGSSVASGSFKVVNGRIIGPDGKDFIARGINAGPQNMETLIASLDAVFPGTNFIRMATQAAWTQYDYTAFVSAMTAKGRVVEIEDHPYPSPRPYTGAQLAAEVAWYAKLANQFKGNPYVWFGTMNEPGGDMSYQDGGPLISAQHLATYNAIRSTGSNAILMMDPFGGGNPGSLGTSGGLTPGAYSGMNDVVWDLHYYNWASGMSNDQNAIAAMLDTMIGQAQQIKSADGIIPVIIGEYGDSSAGNSVDPGGAETVAAVISAGNQGKHGSAAWTWGGSGGADQLTQGLAPTEPYGQMVQLFINTDVTPCTATQTAANAQRSLTQITAQATAEPLPAATTTPASTTPPPSVDATNQAQINTADAAISRANAIISAAKSARP